MVEAIGCIQYQSLITVEPCLVETPIMGTLSIVLMINLSYSAKLPLEMRTSQDTFLVSNGAHIMGVSL